MKVGYTAVPLLNALMLDCGSRNQNRPLFESGCGKALYHHCAGCHLNLAREGFLKAMPQLRR